MSAAYASGLSTHIDKGTCGLPEIADEPSTLATNISALAALWREASHVVVHTGAGVSTAAGIPDFRGPTGVWTLEEQGRDARKVHKGITATTDSWAPTFTHCALVALHAAGRVHHVVSQNVDNLHRKSGLPNEALSELHGNIFMEECGSCRRRAILPREVGTVGRCFTGRKCGEGRCRGRMRDCVLDWDDELLEPDFDWAIKHCRQADLQVTLGTSLQIRPAETLPFSSKNGASKTVICNLQSTRYDKRAVLVLRGRVDDIMRGVCAGLGVEVCHAAPEAPQPRVPHATPRDLRAVDSDHDFPLSDPAPAPKRTRNSK